MRSSKRSSPLMINFVFLDLVVVILVCSLFENSLRYTLKCAPFRMNDMLLKSTYKRRQLITKNKRTWVWLQGYHQNKIFISLLFKEKQGIYSKTLRQSMGNVFLMKLSNAFQRPKTNPNLQNVKICSKVASADTPARHLLNSTRRRVTCSNRF